MTGSIRLTTAVPGPGSSAIMRRKDGAVPRGVNTALPVVIEEADGGVLTDVDGNRLLDFAGGIGCLNVGSRHPQVQEAIARQLERLVHVSAQCAFYEPYVALAERLADLAPGADAKKVFLVNSGSEAIENAVKLARSFTGRQAVIGFTNSFHGRTATALALTSRAVPLKSGFGPLTPEIYRSSFPYPFRDGTASPAESTEAALRDLRRVVEVEIGATEVAAVVVEPIQGEGGFIVPPADFLPRLAEYCAEHGILVIADEIQAGMGRTGHLFASETFGIRPDLIAVGKSLASGLPLAAVIGSAEIMDAPPPGGLGGTYTGNPVACAAAMATLDVLEKESLPQRAARIGEWISRRTASWTERYPVVGEIRGIGAMQAFELVRPGSTEAAPEICEAVVSHCLEHGLLMLRAGTFANVARFLGPLTLSDAQLDEGFTVIESALETVG